jgi:2-dehydro-3-deoxyphosphogluconate aldolase/(4S)-4-hydroxy-2-oxoglutarate aldolase
VFSPFADPELVEAAGSTPMVLGALTPSEVDQAVRAGAAGVQVIPCDAMGTLYARVLPAMFPGVPLIAAGRLERFQAEMWLDAGAVAVMPLGQITTAHVTEPDLAELRRRCQGLV